MSSTQNPIERVLERVVGSQPGLWWMGIHCDDVLEDTKEAEKFGICGRVISIHDGDETVAAIAPNASNEAVSEGKDFAILTPIGNEEIGQYWTKSAYRSTWTKAIDKAVREYLSRSNHRAVAAHIPPKKFDQSGF